MADHSAEFQFEDFSCEMTFEDQVALEHLATGTFKNLFKHLADFHKEVTLASYTWEYSARRGMHMYAFTAADTREWHQTVDFTVDEADPPMTFAVTDAWKKSEFMHHRAVRDEIIALHSSVHLHKLEATFS